MKHIIRLCAVASSIFLVGATFASASNPAAGLTGMLQQLNTARDEDVEIVCQTILKNLKQESLSAKDPDIQYSEWWKRSQALSSLSTKPQINNKATLAFWEKNQIPPEAHVGGIGADAVIDQCAERYYAMMKAKGVFALPRWDFPPVVHWRWRESLLWAGYKIDGQFAFGGTVDASAELMALLDDIPKSETLPVRIRMIRRLADWDPSKKGIVKGRIEELPRAQLIRFFMGSKDCSGLIVPWFRIVGLLNRTDELIRTIGDMPDSELSDFHTSFDLAHDGSPSEKREILSLMYGQARDCLAELVFEHFNDSLGGMPFEAAEAIAREIARRIWPDNEMMVSSWIDLLDSRLAKQDTSPVSE